MVELARKEWSGVEEEGVPSGDWSQSNPSEDKISASKRKGVGLSRW
jgi:hypothetical protein